MPGSSVAEERICTVDDIQATSGARASDRQGEPMSEETETTGWTGWIMFASIMMLIAGTLNALYGLVAILNDEWVVWGNRGAVYFDMTAWGWVHLILGLVLIAAGIGIMSGIMVARIVAVIVVGISMIVNFMAIPIYPVWSLVVLALEVFVLWALIVHGRD